MYDFRNFRTLNQVRRERQQKYARTKIDIKVSLEEGIEEGLGDWGGGSVQAFGYYSGWDGFAQFIDDHFGPRSLRSNCECCGYGGFHFGADFWHEFATMVAMDVRRPDALLNQYRALVSVLGGRFFQRDNICNTRAWLKDDSLSPADKRVIEWQDEHRFKHPELTLEAIAAQPDEAAAFYQLRDRVISTLSDVPANEWSERVDLNFDVERSRIWRCPCCRCGRHQYRSGKADQQLICYNTCWHLKLSCLCCFLLL